MKFMSVGSGSGDLGNAGGLYHAFLDKPEVGFKIDACEKGDAVKCLKKMDQCGMSGRPALAACCTPFAIGFPKSSQTDMAKSACEHAKKLSEQAKAQGTTAGGLIDAAAKQDRSKHVGQVVRFLRTKVGGYFCGGKGGCPRGVGVRVDCSVTSLKCGAGITCCNS